MTSQTPLPLTTVLLTKTNVALLLTATILLSLLQTWLRAPRYPKTLPWVGQGKSSLAAVRNMKSWIQSGYDTYSKNGRAFAIPGLLGTPPEVVVPRAQMQWMLDQPDAVISTAEAHYDILNGSYSFVDRCILGDPYHDHVIPQKLARHLTALVPDIDEQVRAAVDRVYGTDEGTWKTVNIWDSLMQFIPRVTHRILVSRPLCENEDYIAGMIAFSEAVTRDLILVPLIPSILKPIICPILGLSTKWHYWKTARHSVPVIQKRLDDMAAHDRGDPAYKSYTPPNDYITWHIACAKADGRVAELNPHRLAQRILPINFGSIHTTVLTGLSALLDMLAHDAEQHILASIREEIFQVAATEKLAPGGYWTKASLAKLHRLDSALRESMRISGFSQTLISRKVIAKDGVTNPATGEHFAYGTMLVCPVWAAHHDPETYGEAAERYDAFRLSRERERYEAGEEKRPEEGLRVAKMGMVTTTLDHFPFGHGRHAW